MLMMLVDVRAEVELRVDLRVAVVLEAVRVDRDGARPGMVGYFP